MFAVVHSEWLNLYVLKCHVIKSILNVQVRMVKRWLLVSSNKFGSVQVRQQKLVQSIPAETCYGRKNSFRTSVAKKNALNSKQGPAKEGANQYQQSTNVRCVCRMMVCWWTWVTE